jgi:hypothetical protein
MSGANAPIAAIPGREAEEMAACLTHYFTLYSQV